MNAPADPAPRRGAPVSVVATVLNEERSVPALLASLRAQTLLPDDVCIVDGGSSDATWSLLVAAAASWPALHVIEDKSCRIEDSAGPIARGRNVAIAHARCDILACVDAGCTYGPDWLDRLTAALRRGEAEYALGGSCIDPATGTLWDVASAPFFGVALSQAAPTKSCTARSMAFARSLWQRIGGFAETTWLGEDTLFDAQARKLVQPTFAERAKAHYQPRHTFSSALRILGRYAEYDGALRLRRARLIRNAERCLLQIVAVVFAWWHVWPLVAVLCVEVWFAVARDGRDLWRAGPKFWPARLALSPCVPWLVTLGMLRGMRRGYARPRT